MSGMEKQALTYRGFLIPHSLIALTGAGVDVFAKCLEGRFAELRDKIGSLRSITFLKLDVASAEAQYRWQGQWSGYFDNPELGQYGMIL
jgi:hypothetical protein